MVRFEREVPGVVEVDFRVWIIPLECLGAGGQEERIVLAPDGKKWGTPGPKIFLELWVKRDVARVIQEEVELYLVIARASQQHGIELVRFRCDQVLIRDAIQILRPGGLGCEKSR